MKQIVEARLAELRNQEQQAFAAWQALGGAVQATEWILHQFDTQDTGGEEPPVLTILGDSEETEGLRNLEEQDNG